MLHNLQGPFGGLLAFVKHVGEVALAAVLAVVHRSHEDTSAAFLHHDKGDLPFLNEEGMKLRLIAGSLFNLKSQGRVHGGRFSTQINLGSCRNWAR